MTLAINDLQAGYGSRRVLHGLSINLAAGESIALIGHNGTGKSTLLRCLSGQIVPMAGTIRFDGLSASRIVRLGIVQVPAGRRVFPRLSVRDNLEAGAFTRTDRTQAAADLNAMMDRFPVLGRKQRLPAGVLSGGEQQLLAIARGLMARPRLLMVDEPSLGLSPVMVDEVFDALGALVAGGMALILAEQNVRKALQVTHRAYVLAQGRVSAEGPSATLLDDGVIRRSYLGLGQAASFGALVDACWNATRWALPPRAKTLGPSTSSTKRRAASMTSVSACGPSIAGEPSAANWMHRSVNK
jgi:branched-chain amino acid transport system ATP-binding protein